MVAIKRVLRLQHLIIVYDDGYMIVLENLVIERNFPIKIMEVDSLPVCQHLRTCRTSWVCKRKCGRLVYNLGSHNLDMPPEDAET